jgi:hypothetical protein
MFPMRIAVVTLAIMMPAAFAARACSTLPAHSDRAGLDTSAKVDTWEDPMVSIIAIGR